MACIITSMYLVVACPRCRRSRVVEQQRKTTTCGSCGRTLKLAEQRIWFTGPDLDEARRMVGMVNARLSGREEEYERHLLPAAPAAIAPRHDGPLDAAVAATRRGRGETARAELLARTLSHEMGAFEEEDLVEACRLAGLRAPEKHLARLLATHVLIEPRAGQYRAA